jgi:protein SCO1/2
VILLLLVALTDADRAVLTELAFEQKLGAQVPMDLTFQGRSLRDWSAGRPTILALAFYECPMLCTLVLSGLAKALKVVDAEYTALTVSINPKESPALAQEKAASYRAGPNWHFLTGDEASIRTLADSVGFRYAYVAETGQYAHPSGLVFLTPEGMVSRYLFGVEFAPRDVALALAEARQGAVSSPIERLLLYCFQYDPSAGGYGLLVMRVVRIAGVLTIATLLCSVFWMLRREHT